MPLVLEPEKLAENPTFLSYAIPVIQELHRRIRHPYFRYVPDSSEDRNQLSFHQSDAPTRLVLGGNQSGKSRSVAEELKMWLCGDHPWLKTPRAPQIYVLSAQYTLLEAGIWSHLKDVLPEWKVAKYGPQIHGTSMPAWILMVDGGKLTFQSAFGPREARRKAQAARLHLIVVDEEVDGALIQELGQRLLAHGGRMIISCTAVESADWIVDLEERATEGDPRIFLVRLDTRAAARAGHIDKETLEDKVEGMTEEDFQVRVLGETRKYEGLVYSEIRPDHWIEPRKIPPEWTRYCALDPGTRVFAVLWAAVAPNDRVYFYREMYFQGGMGSRSSSGRKSLLDITNEIHAAEGWNWNHRARIWEWGEKTERILIRWMDPAPFGTADLAEPQLTRGMQIARAPYCLPCSPAPNDVEAGIEEVKQGLRYAPDGKPIYNFFTNLKNLRVEFRKYRRERDTDPSKAERPARPRTRNNHLLDCMRYMALGGLRYVSQSKMRLTREELKWAQPRTGDLRTDAKMLDMYTTLVEHERAEPKGVNVGGMGTCW